jgi:hypothetical protein
MTRKRLIIGIALLGISLILGGNAWAGQDQGGKRHKNEKTYHQGYKTPPGHHYGWEKGKKNPHQSRYRPAPAYRHRDHHRRPVVEKHVHHHYRSEGRQDDNRFNIAVSVIDNVLGVAVAVSRTY